MPDKKYSDKELLEELRWLSSELGKPPSQSDMTEVGNYGAGTYRNRFGTWNNALRRAGLEVNQLSNEENRVSKDELKAELGRLSDIVDGIPTAKEVSEYSKFALNTFKRRFDTWNDALRESGFDVKYENDIPESNLRWELYRLYDELGRPPTQTDMDKYGRYSSSLYGYRFDSWGTILEELGFDVQGPPTGERHYNWSGGETPYYGPNWREQRRRRREKDEYTCQVCGDHQDSLDRSLNVHHITPRRYFIERGELDHEKANDLSNLISLCPSCHSRFEGHHIFHDADTWPPANGPQSTFEQAARGEV